MTLENPEFLEILSKERDELARQRMELPTDPHTGFYLDSKKRDELSKKITELTIKIAPPGL